MTLSCTVTYPSEIMSIMTELKWKAHWKTWICDGGYWPAMACHGVPNSETSVVIFN